MKSNTEIFGKEMFGSNHYYQVNTGMILDYKCYIWYNYLSYNIEYNWDRFFKELHTSSTINTNIHND